MIPTPDRRLRVFISSTLGELAEEREAARLANERWLSVRRWHYKMPAGWPSKASRW